MQEMTTDEWTAPLHKRNLLPENALAAFVVGSAARGWHNARSDYDIYVVLPAERAPELNTNPLAVPLDPPFAYSETFYEQGKRWDVTYWVAAHFDQMVSKVSWEAYEGGTVAEDALSRREELWLARLGNCLPLAGLEWIETARERLRASAFRSFIVVRSLGESDNAVEDALGQMEAGDLRSATISARTALGHAIDALLEGEGEYGSHLTKWRANRFQAAAPEALSFEEYWALETMQGYDPADPRPWITKVLTICQDISMRVETS